MFRWRSLIAIVAFASIFALVFSEFRRQQESHLSKRTRRAIQRRELTKSFAAQSPARKYGVDYDMMKRDDDVCAAAYPGRVSQTCSPSQTLCCVVPSGALPQCTTILGYGFCCTEHTDCFVDLDTACGTSGATTCAAGLCCPAQTSCIDDITYDNSTLVRCNVDRNIIPSSIAALASSSSSSIASSSTSGTASSSTTGTVTAPIVSQSQSVTATPSPSASSPPSSSGLGGGAIAGIVIGAVAGIAIIAGLAWFFLRRGKGQNTTNASAAVPPTYNPVPQEAPTGVQEMSNQQVYEAPGSQGFYGQGQDAPVKYANQGNEGRRHELA